MQHQYSYQSHIVELTGQIYLILETLICILFQNDLIMHTLNSCRTLHTQKRACRDSCCFSCIVLSHVFELQHCLFPTLNEYFVQSRPNKESCLKFDVTRTCMTSVFFQHMFYSTRLLLPQVKGNTLEKGTMNFAYCQNRIKANISQMHLNSFQLGPTIHVALQAGVSCKLKTCTEPVWNA